MTSRLERYIDENGLVETTDPEVEKAIFRRPSYEDTPTFAELDRRLSDGLREARDKSGLTHADVAPLLGLHPIVYGRYERSETQVTDRYASREIFVAAGRQGRRHAASARR